MAVKIVSVHFIKIIGEAFMNQEVVNFVLGWVYLKDYSKFLSILKE